MSARTEQARHALQWQSIPRLQHSHTKKGLPRCGFLNHYTESLMETPWLEIHIPMRQPAAVSRALTDAGHARALWLCAHKRCNTRFTRVMPCHRRRAGTVLLAGYICKPRKGKQHMQRAAPLQGGNHVTTCQVIFVRQARTKGPANCQLSQRMVFIAGLARCNIKRGAADTS